MSKIITYLKYEGLAATLKKISEKFSKDASVTVFLKCDELLSNPVQEDIELTFQTLSTKNVQDFLEIKFFDHILPEYYMNSEHSQIIVAYLNGHAVGYIAAEYGILKTIHGLGTFQLNSGEAWIGPAYVKRKYRSQGINRKCIQKMLETLSDQHEIQKFYTSINQKNISSLKSIAKLGFRECGTVCVSKTGAVEDFPSDMICRFTQV